MKFILVEFKTGSIHSIQKFRTMVRIINFKERNKEDGTSFFVLELQGGIEMVLSKSTGNFYATAKKAFITSTFDEQTCSALVGTEIQGSIIKEECEPYDFVVKETGEEITLYHRWVFVPEDIPAPVIEDAATEVTKNLQPNAEQFSQNGALEYA